MYGDAYDEEHDHDAAAADDDVPAELEEAANKCEDALATYGESREQIAAFSVAVDERCARTRKLL